ncbi:MAG: cell envelope integrity protein CreD [Gilvibacter sp.]
MDAQKGKFSHWMRHSITARMLVVGVLIALLLTPLAFVQELIYERAGRQQDVVQEINQKWGNKIILSGPILKIPYKTYKQEELYNQNTKKTTTVLTEVYHTAYLFPEVLQYDSNVETKPLKRSIYESVVFTAAIDVAGNFSQSDFSSLEIPQKDVLWDKATIIVQTSNLKGIKNTLTIQLGDQVLEVAPRYDEQFLNTIESTPIANLEAFVNTGIPFDFTLDINGSESIAFIPLGKETTASMQSNWHSPSFDGNYLPNDQTKQISDSGFKADWSVLQINREFEQQFYDHLPNLSSFAFGTKLVIPVDHYTQSERSSKYGILVIGLTLFVFLLIQIVSKIYIHPFQYLLIGLALVLFYTLLVSISEHQPFTTAYLIASSSVIVLITLFAKALLKGIKFALMIFSSLAALYGFIYVIIQLENYALLVGSIGLFTILAIIMYVTRKIDWINES